MLKPGIKEKHYFSIKLEKPSILLRKTGIWEETSPKPPKNALNTLRSLNQTGHNPRFSA
jgi:hypothetical protein